MTMDMMKDNAPCGLPAATEEKRKRYPLQLNIQFFADPPGNDPQDPPADPPGGSEDDLTLADLLKTNPKIKAEYSDRVEKAIKKRFKDIDPEAAAQALEEKKLRDEQQGNQEQIETQQVQTLTKEKAALLKVAKEAAVITYAAGEGLDPNLIIRLAASDVDKLQLNDTFKADPEDVGEIVDGLRAEFPDLFPKTDPEAATPPPTNNRRGYVPGPNNQRTNTPPPPANKGVEATRERVERLKKLGRI